MPEAVLREQKSGRPSVDSIQTEIVRRICFLEYEPGRQLKEATLATEFGVSRTPIRDAISRIKHLGLVETLNGVGTVVVALSDAHIREIYEMRLHLASLIGTVSPKPLDADAPLRAREMLQVAKKLKHKFDPARYVALNDRLQLLIADLIGNEVLRSFWMQTYYQAASTWYHVAIIAPEDAAAGLVQELAELIEALENGDPAAVGFLQRIHIGYGFRRIERHLLSKANSRSHVSA